MTDLNANPPKPHGKTFWDFLDTWIKMRYGALSIVVTLVLIPSLIWWLVNSAAAPGAEISLLGAIKYVKPAQPSDVAASDAVARSKALEQGNSELAASLRRQQDISSDLQSKLNALGAAASGAVEDGKSRSRVDQLEQEIARLNAGLQEKAAACGTRDDDAVVLRQRLSQCEQKPVKMPGPPSVFLFRMGAAYSDIASCKSAAIDGLGRFAPGQVIKNYSNAVAIDHDQYFLYVLCDDERVIVVAGPDYSQAQTTAMLLWSYMNSH